MASIAGVDFWWRRRDAGATKTLQDLISPQSGHYRVNQSLEMRAVPEDRNHEWNFTCEKSRESPPQKKLPR